MRAVALYYIKNSSSEYKKNQGYMKNMLWNKIKNNQNKKENKI